MKLRLFLLSPLSIFFLYSPTHAQNIAINTTGATANASAMLDISSTTSGLLIPRMTSAQRSAIATPSQGLIVYDLTLNAFYYYNAGWWPLLANSNSGLGGWSLTGNSGTTAGTNFIGTIDAIDWVVKTNNTERMRVTSSGFVGIGTSAPGARLTVIGDGTGTAYIGGNFCGGNYTGISLNGQIGGCGVYNILSSPTDQNFYLNRPSGFNMYFRENNGDQMCILTGGNVGIGTTGPSYRLHVFNSVAGLPTGYFENSSASGYALYGINSAGASQTNGGVGVFGLTSQASNNQTVSGGIVGKNSNNQTPGTTGGTAVIGAGCNQIYNYLLQGQGGAFTGYNYGMFSQNINFAAFTQQAGMIIFDGGGNQLLLNAWSAANTHYKIWGGGAWTVSCSVPDLQGNMVTLHCPETPEFYFEDYGEGRLVNGKVHIDIDPILAKNIVISDKHPLRVFIQLEDNENCKGVVIKNKTATGFDVVELDGGTSNTPFTWHIVCNVADHEESGRTNHTADLRFEPGPILQKTALDQPK